MYGPAPIPPPRRAARAARVLVRVLFAAVPPATIGILSWIPMLRLAVRSRRAWDWVGCGLVVLLATGAFVLVGQSDDDSSWASALGMAVLLLLAVGVPVHFLVADLRWHDAGRRASAAAPGHAPTGAWSVPTPVPTPLPAPVSTPTAAPVRVPFPAPVPAPGGRIDQVRAELDELSAYLRDQGGR
ncbi:hypothetical protein [Streptacidiphilus carbonis]|uniref:hypothetical protein n=1 Tax=Streptacidiphilus carbonis TaxID=105422 RepID=UPI0005AB63DB|nr:hypothetical protein [Streptacidiphilus carbonis]